MKIGFCCSFTIFIIHLNWKQIKFFYNDFPLSPLSHMKLIKTRLIYLPQMESTSLPSQIVNYRNTLRRVGDPRTAMAWTRMDVRRSLSTSASSSTWTVRCCYAMRPQDTITTFSCEIMRLLERQVTMSPIWPGWLCKPILANITTLSPIGRRTMCRRICEDRPLCGSSKRPIARIEACPRQRQGAVL